MTLRQAFLDASRRLAVAPNPTESPELDARVLLGHVAGLSHAGLLARWPDPLPDEVQGRFEAALARRLAGEPVAWITGFKEFLGLDFEVGPGLLVPRADTETLVEAALNVAVGPCPRQGFRVADICTGTGCVAVGLASMAPRTLEVWACDLSPVAVATARRNSDRLLSPERRVTVVESNLLAALPGSWDLIVSNPPYLTPEETAERVGPLGWREPALALDGGGPDGLDLLRILVPQAVAALNPGGWLLVEAGGPQMPQLRRLLEEAGLRDLRIWPDLAGVDRVVGGRKRP